MSTENDLLLGQIAMELGFVTKFQLQECLRIQSADLEDAEANLRPPKPLGQILLERGVVAQTDLESILREQNRRLQQLAQYLKARKQDVLIGKRLVAAGVVTKDQANECLRLQSERSEGGTKRPPRLGEVLVEQGYATAEAVAAVLRDQAKARLYCGLCDLHYNVAGYQAGRVYRCPRCDAPLERPDPTSGLGAAETIYPE